MEEIGAEPIKQAAGFAAGFASAEAVEPARQVLSTDSHIAVPTIVLVSQGRLNQSF